MPRVLCPEIGHIGFGDCEKISQQNFMEMLKALYQGLGGYEKIVHFLQFIS
jgi:hypothetical protein